MKKYGFKLRDRALAIELSIPRRSKSIARALVKYPRKDFAGTDNEKSYLLGFRAGDLNVEKNEYGETVYVSSSTSKSEQLELMRSLFVNYGKISTYNLKSGCTQFMAPLNDSFEFLLPKDGRVPEWILQNNDAFLHFLGGYVDAEGSFGIYNGFAEFSLGSYDFEILFAIHSKLEEFGVFCQRPKITSPKGYIDKRGVRNNKDLYRLRITTKEHLLSMISLLKHVLRHRKRITDMLNAEQSILERNKRV